MDQYADASLPELLQLAPLAHRFALWVRDNPLEAIVELNDFECARAHELEGADEWVAHIETAAFPWNRLVPGLGWIGIRDREIVDEKGRTWCRTCVVADGRSLGDLPLGGRYLLPDDWSDGSLRVLRAWAEYVVGVGERFLAERQISPIPLEMPLPYLPTCAISEEAAALHEVLADAAGVKLQGKSLVAKLAKRRPPVLVDEQRIVGLVKELRKAGIPVESRQGSPGYALPPRLGSRNSRQIATE